MAPKFTIIISTYNRASTLSVAIRSALSQSLREFCLIIADDASTDNTKEVVDSFRDSRITYLCNRKNSGLSSTRNAALKLVNGSYVVLIDDDTELKADFLERLNKIISETEADAYCPRVLGNTEGEPYVGIFAKIRKKYLGYLDFNYCIGLAQIINYEALRNTGYYDERFGIGSRYQAAEETDLFFRLKQQGRKVLYCPELTAYHRNEDNVAKDKVFRYSCGIAAVLAKHATSDIRHSYIYLYILLQRILVSLMRSIQYLISPKSICKKNKIYRYKYFFLGTIKGFFYYLISNEH
jgi:glycosyltransferase involved in cell wall biosynthesis